MYNGYILIKKEENDFFKPSGNIREKGLLLTGPGNVMACLGHTVRSQIEIERLMAWGSAIIGVRVGASVLWGHSALVN